MSEEQRITWAEQIKALIQFYHEQTGVKYTVIGRRAIGNPNLWERLSNGGSITLDKADQLISWMSVQGFKINHKGEIYVEN